EVVRGVAEHAGRIDELISTYAEGWTLDRMPSIDRNLSRIAVYELVFRDDIDAAVAISEAVELAEELSTDESPRFLNGLLARIAEYARRYPAPPGAAIHADHDLQFMTGAGKAVSRHDHGDLGLADPICWYGCDRF